MALHLLQQYHDVHRLTFDLLLGFVPADKHRIVQALDGDKLVADTLTRLDKADREALMANMAAATAEVRAEDAEHARLDKPEFDPYLGIQRLSPDSRALEIAHKRLAGSRLHVRLLGVLLPTIIDLCRRSGPH